MIQAERIAEEHGVAIDEVLRELQEIEERIQREGLEAELHRFARDSGMSDEKARALYEASWRIAASDLPTATTSNADVSVRAEAQVTRRTAPRDAPN